MDNKENLFTSISDDELDEAELLSAIIDTMGALLIVLDKEGRIIRFNRACENLSSYSFNEVRGRRFWDFLIPAEEIEGVKDTFKKLNAESINNKYENHWITKNGAYRLISWANTAITDRREEVEYIIATGIDVTEQRQAEALLQLLESAVQQSNDAVLVTTAELEYPGPEIVFVNPAFTKMTGYSMEEIKGKTPRILLGEKTDCNLIKEMNRSLTEGVDFRGEMFNYRKDGSEYIAEWDVAPVKNIKGKTTHFIAIQQDVTERKKAEQKMFYIMRAVEVSSDAIGMTNSERQSIYHNQAFINLLGYTPEQLNAVGGTSALYTDPEIARQVREKLENNQTWKGEINLRSREGNTVLVAMTADAVQDEAGKVIGKIVIYTDIRERKRAEQQIRQTQKMEAVGRLAGGIAHDFNNMLTAISGYSELTLRLLKADDPLTKNIREIKKAAERSTALTRQLLGFSRRQMQQLKILDINTVITDLQEMLSRLIGEDLRFKIKLDPDLGQVKADPAQIEQILMNLVVNARDAMPEGGQITIETKNTILDKSFEGNNLGSRAGAYILLSVCDTGIGMDSDTRGRIFEPFFTTKEVGKGTGLGLATVYGIVKQSDGYITVQSALNQGSTFEIYLPRVDQPKEDLKHSQEKGESLHGSETVLLTEDEPLVRRLAQEVLELSGYVVLTAGSGEEAIEVARNYEKPIHLLLSDIVMPGMSGHQLAENLAPLCPGMKILFMSGYSSEVVAKHGKLSEQADFLEKPFSPESLAAKVRSALDSTK